VTLKIISAVRFFSAKTNQKASATVFKLSCVQANLYEMHHTCICSSLTHSLTAALDQLRVVASSTSNDSGQRSRQHQQIGQCLLPLAAANFSVDDPAGASSQQREECRCGLLLTVAVPAKQVCSPVGDRCDQIMNDVCQQ